MLAILLAWPLPAYAQTDDPLYSQQWGLHAIGAPDAWGVSRGEGVIIAVIDTGVDLDHPDLEQKLIQGFSLVDDAGPQDRHGHGTLIAGIAGATTGNGEGIASVAPEARILPARVFDLEGNATSSRVTDAIRLAIDAAERRGAKLVLNLSFVGPAETSPPVGDPGGAIFQDKAVREAIEDAAAGGAVVVAASGNDGMEKTAFDAPDGSGMIVVGASDQQGRCAPFTNYGTGLDILAPGVGIVSTFLNAGERDSGYAHADGTSIAVPAVSGAAALLLSDGLTNVEAVERIISTAQGPSVKCRDERSSYKVLDVAAAVSVDGPQTGERDRLSLPTVLHPAENERPVPMESPVPAAAPPSDDVEPLMDVTALRALAAAALLLVSTLLWSRSTSPRN